MYKKVLLSAIAASLIIGQTAVAYPPGPPPGHHPPPAYALPPRPQAYQRPPPPQGYNRYKFSNSWRGSHGRFRPGYAMPSYYRGKNYQRHVIDNWQGHGLYAPPHGHHWLLVDGNFVLAAIGTGIVAQILLGH